MPIIVPIEENLEGIAGQTDAKFRAPDYSGSGLEALGAGLTKAGRGGEQFAAALDEKRRRELAAAVAAAKLDDDHRHNVDDAAVKKTYVDYSDRAHEALRGDDGLFNQRGADAHAAFPDLVSKLVDNHDKVLASLDEVQRAAIAPALGARLRSDVDLAANHVREQGKAEQELQSQNLQQAAARDAVANLSDPDLHEHHIATGENAIRQQGMIEQRSDQEIANRMADYRSGVIADTIVALGTSDPARAAQWFARYRGTLNQQEKARVAATLAPMLSEAQAMAADAGEPELTMDFQPRIVSFDNARALRSRDATNSPWPGGRVGPLAYDARIGGESVSGTGGTSMAAAVKGTSGQQTAKVPDVAPAEDGELAVLRPVERRAPLVSGEVDGQVVLAAKVKPQDASRLNGRDIIVTPEMRAIALANIDQVRVRAGPNEKTSVAYLMPDGTVQVRPLDGPGTTHGASDEGDSMSGKTSGPGRPLFIIHGHIEKNTSSASGLSSGAMGDEGMVDNILDERAKGYGDTYSMMTLGIPVATVYNGYIGWHEMRGGQLLFSAPKAAFGSGHAHALQDNLSSEQGKFLTPKPRHKSKSK
jgi:hypothetical protein